MNGKYILDERGEPVSENDLLKWAAWFETHMKIRVVARCELANAVISTVFLGLDHRFGDGPPLIWETMVFGGPMDQEMDRCGGSREQAEAMHQRMVERVKAIK